MNSTIAAISTPLTAGAIGIVRLSGPEAKRIAGEVFRPIGHRRIDTVPGYSAIYGHVCQNGEDIDEAVCVVLVNDVALEGLDRFKGKKVLKMGVSDLIKKSDAVMKKIHDSFQ